jgi:hypothetical protein
MIYLYYTSTEMKYERIEFYLGGTMSRIEGRRYIVDAARQGVSRKFNKED